MPFSASAYLTAHTDQRCWRPGCKTSSTVTSADPRRVCPLSTKFTGHYPPCGENYQPGWRTVRAPNCYFGGSKLLTLPVDWVIEGSSWMASWQAGLSCLGWYWGEELWCGGGSSGTTGSGNRVLCELTSTFWKYHLSSASLCPVI